MGKTGSVLFPEWQAAHQPQKIYPSRIRQMWNLYGKCEGETCGHCTNLYIKQFAGRYLKCKLNRDSNGPGTDWRSRWPACGKFEHDQEFPI